MCKCNLQTSMHSQGVTPPCNTQDKKSHFHGVSQSVIYSYFAEKTEPKLLRVLFIRVLQSHEQNLWCVVPHRGITFLFIEPGITSVNKKKDPEPIVLKDLHTKTGTLDAIVLCKKKFCHSLFSVEWTLKESAYFFELGLFSFVFLWQIGPSL